MKKTLSIIIFFFFVSFNLFAQSNYYVDINATGTNSGESWPNAFNDLQDALIIAVDGDSVFVAEGTYYPDDLYSAVAFNIPSGVVVLGGYPNGGGIRDWSNNATILSGELQHGLTRRYPNSYHVVRTTNVTESTIVDGFTITKGQARNPDGTRPGGGWYNDGSGTGNSSNPTIRNCIFIYNDADGGGGAIYNDGIEGESSPSITNCTFKSNSTGFPGGAISNVGNDGISNPTIANCVFISNSGYYGGGAVANDGRNGQCNPSVINCVFINNSADSGGGDALYNYYSNPTITNCIIWNNTGDDIFDDSSTPIVTYSILQTYTGGTGCLTGVDPLFIDEADPDGPDNIWMTVDDGLQLSACSPAINAGDNSAIPTGITTDITSINPRIIDTIVDMGAYETSTKPPGTGTSGNPYQISTFDHLVWISNNPGSWSSHFIQTADIDASTSTTCDGGVGFSPIGNNPNSFWGSYDGQDFTIDGLYINRPTSDYIGLFGVAAGAISSLGVINSSISGKDFVGVVVGRYSYYNESINNCYATGTLAGNSTVGGLVGRTNSVSSSNILIRSSYADVVVTGSGNYIGGLCGFNSYTTIIDCYATNEVSGVECIGGLVGLNEFSDIIDCFSDCSVNGTSVIGGLIGSNQYSRIYNSFAAGIVTGSGNNVGGLLGINSDESSYITNNYATGAVSGDNRVGGLVGYNATNVAITNSYATGSITGNNDIGGLIGMTDQYIINENSFWDTETSGLSGTDDGVGNQTRTESAVYGKTTSEMKDLATFTLESTIGLTTAWDFESNPYDDVANEQIWDLCPSINTGYPILSWQNGEDVCLDDCINGSIIYNIQTNKFNFCEDGIWVEK